MEKHDHGDISHKTVHILQNIVINIKLHTNTLNMKDAHPQPYPHTPTQAHVHILHAVSPEYTLVKDLAIKNKQINKKPKSQAEKNLSLIHI